MTGYDLETESIPRLYDSEPSGAFARLGKLDGSVRRSFSEPIRPDPPYPGPQESPSGDVDWRKVGVERGPAGVASESDGDEAATVVYQSLNVRAALTRLVTGAATAPQRLELLAECLFRVDWKRFSRRQAILEF